MTANVYNIDKIRKKEYPNLNKTCYLDYGGTTPYAKSLVDNSATLWKSDLYGNPHSHSASSMLATEYVNRARRRVLEFFRADLRHFDVVFVANATAAIKLVAQAFQEQGFWYGFHGDSHTSLVGIREIANNGFHCFASDNEFEEWIASLATQDAVAPLVPVDYSDAYNQVKDNGLLKLVGYPAQSNMNGHRTPMDWAYRIRKRARASGQEVYTLLDAAAYCSSAQLDLSDPEAAPDFTSLSFYKIFGMPDLGALIVRKNSSAILKSRRYFGGGTVDMVIAYDHFHAMKTENVHDVLEDGTLPFHNLIMLETAITLHKRLFHSMDAISKHATQLTLNLYQRLSSLRHSNGRLVCEIYKDAYSTYGDSITQGPTIAFNIRMANGALVQYDHVEALASACNIQIRTGGVCNPGGIAGHLHLSNWEMRRNYCEGFRCGEPFKIRGGKALGIVRASLGGMSSQHDVDIFVAFIHHFFVENELHNLKVHKGLDGPQQFWTAKQIQVFPVQHCPGWKLPDYQSWEVEPNRLAMDGDWCLVDLRNEKVVDDVSSTKRLTVDLNIQLGKLFLQGLTCGINSQIGVDMWELPKGDWVVDSLEQMPSKAYRLARKFTSKDIEVFLTFVFGYPVTLARFHEFKDGLPIEISLEKSLVRQGAAGINIQFSEATEHRDDVHIVLNPRTTYPIYPQKCPHVLQFGSQTFIRVPFIIDSFHNEHRGNIAQYCRRPDEMETLASQNTAVRASDLISVSLLVPPEDEKPDLRSFQFCPVVGCGEKRDNYAAFIEHLTSHAGSFISLHRKSQWKRLRQLICF